MSLKRYAMAKEGSMFVGDGVSLSWPFNGEREVVELEERSLPSRLRHRVANGIVAEVTDEPTKKAVEPTPYKLSTGAEAKAIMEQPAGPVKVIRHNRHTGEVKEVVVRETRPTPEPEPEVETVKVAETETAEPTLEDSYHVEVEEVAVPAPHSRRPRSTAK